MKSKSSENGSHSGLSLKNYWLSIGVFWTLGGVVLLAMEVKQIKQRVEALDRRIRTASAPRKNEPGSQELGQHSTESKPFRVTEESLRTTIPGKLEAEPVASTSPSKVIEEIRTVQNPAVNEANEVKEVREELAVNTEVTIDDLQVRRVPEGVEARFVMRNNDPGRELEGRIGGVLKTKVDGLVATVGGSTSLEKDGFNPSRLHQDGQFYRFRYRLSKNIVFKTQKFPEDLEFTIEFFMGAAGETPSVIRLPPVKLPRVARRVQDGSRGRDIAIP